MSKDKSKKGLWWKVLLGIGAVAVVGGVLGGQSGPGDAADRSSTSESSASEKDSQEEQKDSSKEDQQPEEKKNTVGSTAALDGIEFTLMSIKETKGLDIDSPEKDSKFVAVHLEIENKTDEKFDLALISNQFKLEDESGIEYEYYIFTGDDLKDFP